MVTISPSRNFSDLPKVYHTLDTPCVQHDILEILTFNKLLSLDSKVLLHSKHRFFCREESLVRFPFWAVPSDVSWLSISEAFCAFLHFSVRLPLRPAVVPSVFLPRLIKALSPPWLPADFRPEAIFRSSFCTCSYSSASSPALSYMSPILLIDPDSFVCGQ